MPALYTCTYLFAFNPEIDPKLPISLHKTVAAIKLHVLIFEILEDPSYFLSIRKLKVR
jgi:hypothetical protein